MMNFSAKTRQRMNQDKKKEYFGFTLMVKLFPGDECGFIFSARQSNHVPQILRFQRRLKTN